MIDYSNQSMLYTDKGDYDDSFLIYLIMMRFIIGILIIF